MDWAIGCESKSIQKMKKNIVFGMLALGAFLMSCEPQEVFDQQFTQAPKDTVYTSGSRANFRLNGVSAVQQSAGFGLACFDTLGSFWALATGNTVGFDPATRSLTVGANDTMFALFWDASTTAVGTYTFTQPLEAFCFIQSPGRFARQYDPRQITVNIVNITPDSIFGNYSGALREFDGIITDSLGNVSFSYTGLVDSVNAVFGVKRYSCF